MHTPDTPKPVFSMKDIEAELANIQAMAYDDETAHSCEDALYADFIKHVAKQNLGELSEMAKKILTSQDIKFCRWCA